ncbi:hypothetical protein BDV59DRAFT_3156 [Aspergillus ambiguus]|uniref:uncharacterized protein n=1 Tax=Aspergillus ambiguus TaxID=176160 RepID=UPI003CCDF9B7
MSSPRPSHTEYLTILDAVGDTVPRTLIGLICTYSPDSIYGDFDLTRELHVACLINNLDRVDDILQMGADPNSVNYVGLSAYDVADLLNRTDVMRRLMSNMNTAKDGISELVRAVRKRHSTVVRILMEMGVNEQLDEDLFRSIFVLACSFSSTLVVDALIKYGPGITVFLHEDMLVQIALSMGNYQVAEHVREIADEERRWLVAEAEEYMVPDSLIDDSLHQNCVDCEPAFKERCLESDSDWTSNALK